MRVRRVACKRLCTVLKCGRGGGGGGGVDVDVDDDAISLQKCYTA